jgi:hypothetical protein
MRRSNLLLLLIGTSQLLVMSITTVAGEDISQSRASFLTGERSDFLGVFAGWFYSIIPGGKLGWGVTLAAMQMLCVLLAFQIELSQQNLSRIKLFVYLFFQYISLYFAAQQSRDGTLFALFCLGLSLIRRAKTVSKPDQRFRVVLMSLICFTLGLSFRPWMFLLLVPLLFFVFAERDMKKVFRSKHVFLFILTLTVIPLSIEYSLSKVLKVKESYPLQTLLIHDLATSACWSADTATSEAALRALEPLSTNTEFEQSICQFFKPNTWQATTQVNDKSSLVNTLSAPISLTTSPTEYRDLIRSWFKLLIQDPKTYFQNKLMLSAQVVFSSQTKTYHASTFFGREVTNNFLGPVIALPSWLFDLPWSLISLLYLLTPGMTLLFFWILSAKCRGLSHNLLLRLPVMSFLCIAWGSITFVSDNARYLTSFIILTYLSLLSAVRLKRGEKN